VQCRPMLLLIVNQACDNKGSKDSSCIGEAKAGRSNTDRAGNSKELLILTTVITIK
jgi:hypothetical protein